MSFHQLVEDHFGLAWLRSLELVEAEKLSDTTARTVFRFPVQPQYINFYKGLHGGAQSLFFDMCTSWTLLLIAKPGSWTRSGTTRNLNLTFMRPPVVPEYVRTESEIVHVGKRLALVRATMRREKDGAVMSTCEHDKYNIDADATKM